MTPIRVHLGPMPRMLRTMINDLLSAEPDMTIVGNSYGPEESLSAASANGADILIEQEGASGPETCAAALLLATPAAILAIDADGRHGTAINLARQPVSLNCAHSSLPKAVRKLLEGGSICGSNS